MTLWLITHFIYRNVLIVFIIWKSFSSVIYTSTQPLDIDVNGGYTTMTHN